MQQTINKKIQVNFSYKGILLHLEGPNELKLVRDIERTKCFYEIDLLEAMAKVLKPGPQLVVDIGSCIGNHTVFFAKVLGKRILSIEPRLDYFEAFNNNLDRNDVRGHVYAIWVAAGDRPCFADLHDDLSIEFRDEPRTRVHKDRVLVKTLDDILLRCPFAGEHVQAIKVDVEGTEPEVLRGAIGIIIRDRPVIAAEAKTKAALKRILELLDGFGYTMEGRYCATPTYLLVSNANTNHR